MLRFFSFLNPAGLIAATAMLSGCANYAYVGLQTSQPTREVEIPGGAQRVLPIASSMVGLAYDDGARTLFVRNLPGTQLQEVDLSGAVQRTFAAQRVPAGCGGWSPDEFPIKECGLGIRLRDRHLFLDHPNGLMIAERTDTGDFVQDIQLQSPRGPIGGVAYDQKSDTIYVLWIRDRTIGEYALDGRLIRVFRASDPATGAAVTIERFGLGMNSNRRELYVGLQNGNRIAAINLSGRKVAEYPAAGAGTAIHGIGAGRRWIWH